MEQVLRGLGYGQDVMDNFHREGVTFEAVPSLTMSQLEELGIEGIGRQAIFRGRCRASGGSSITGSRFTSPEGRRSDVTQKTRQLFSPYGGKKKKANHTLTLTLMCLSTKSTTRVPSTLVQRVLAECGLGEKRVTMPTDASPCDVMDVIYRQFPKLRKGAGFEYMKADGSSKMFHELALPEGGFSASNLRSIAKNSKIYLRPVQCDLDLTSEDAKASDEDETLHECQSCHKLVGQTKLRSHVRKCCKGKQSFQRDEDTTAISSDDELLNMDPFHLQMLEKGGEKSATLSHISASPANTQQSNHLSNSEPLPEPSTSVAVNSAPSVQSTSKCHSSGNSSSYKTYVDLLGEDEEDMDIDDALRMAMEASIQDMTSGSTNAEEAFMQDRIRKWRTDTIEPGRQTVVVRRAKIIPSAVYIICQPSFCFKNKTDIQFSGEDAVDDGGLTREFFRLLTQQLPSLGIFEGRGDSVMFTHDVNALNSGKFKLAGQLIAWSILNNGPGYPAIHPAVYNMMCGVVPSVDIRIWDFPDLEFQTNVSKIKESNSNESLGLVIDDLGAWCADRGCFLSADANKKDEVVAALLKHQMFLRTKAEIDQFCDGLNSIGQFWDVVKAAPAAFKRLFVYTPQTFNKQIFKGLYEIDWAPEGSNEREQQADTIYCWEELLRVYEERATTEGANKLEDLLVFITGCDSIPPTGFDSPIKIVFLKKENEKRYPSSSTCAMELVLPYPIADPKEFEVLMDEAIHEAHGFAKP